ncbi:SDR family oxidoreductase [Deinococcus aestuarii]|uniref:SDR family oxidoreductase n=1 Tax=Deinococcus aestuarii TaxID=2774531 RepID=UPI001C0B7AF6|nr:SDR family oxidoreductase [Deinococcus aestuarii]
MTLRNEPRTALVTGATGGIGQETALELARQGYRVLVTARDAAKGQQVLEDLRAQGRGAVPELFVGDLSSMGDVRRIALEVRDRHGRLDVLVNNAGGVFRERRTTVDGFESTFAFNHLAYFLLTHLLLEPLRAAGRARVVSVSSSANRMGRVRWDDPQFTQGYSPTAAYAQSKLMNILFANALARRLRSTGVTSNSLHPGRVRSGFGEDLTGLTRVIFNLTSFWALSPQQGAQTSVYLATSPEVGGVTGTYFQDKKPQRANRVAYDQAAQDRLWALSEQVVGRWLDPVEQEQAAVPR